MPRPPASWWRPGRAPMARPCCPAPLATSTAEAVIGQVTADLVGVIDDDYGTVSGTPRLVLENPADIAKYIGNWLSQNARPGRGENPSKAMPRSVLGS